MEGLEDKWRTDSPDYPLCALCSKQIGSEEEDDKLAAKFDDDYHEETVEPEVATRIWRTEPEQPTLEMAFHSRCLTESGRMRK